MADLQQRRFEAADTRRSFPNGKAEFLGLGDQTLMMLTFQPGFKWSESIGPMVNTQSCEAKHLWYVISGRMHIRMNDGTEAEFGSGDVASVPAGHDGWTVGDEPAVLLDITGADRFAK